SFRYGDRLLDPDENIQLYLQTALLTPRLDTLHSYLWLVGLPRPAPVRHHQRLLSRTIFAYFCPTLS
ncbi:hypothetical protein B0I35DRAFT_441912, partial [Stachybotrys elegans]